MNVLIAGCGYVGCELGRQLVAAGHGAWGLRRRPEGLPDGVVPVGADLSRPDTLASLPPGIDHVVYAVGAGSHDEVAYRSAYVDGPLNLLAALTAAGAAVARVVFVSSTGVYGQSGGEWVDETSPTEPAGFSGRILLEGERAVLGGPFPATVLRLGGIYGPGRTRLVDSVRSGRATVAPGGPSYTNRIHRDDAAGAIAHLLALPAPGPVYLGVDHDPADERDVLTELAALLGVPAPREGDPSDRPPGRRGGNKRCSNARLVASGYDFRYPTFREGYRALLLS